MFRSSIIIPVHNQSAVTRRCLEALAQQVAEIIVVDDASTDATPQLLKDFSTRIKTISHSLNQGFATSCNHGAAVAGGEFLVFLNNDTVPAAGWLEALVRYADLHPEASIIGAKLLYPDDTVQHAGVVICQDRYPRHIYAGFPADYPAVNKSRQFQVVTAACMLVRRSAFGQAGGFSAAFRNGFEDVDFCLRLRQMGHQVHYCAESVVQHLESVSPGRFKHAGANVALYRELWFGRVRPDDVEYYLEDGLLQFAYEGSFPLRLSVSPRLALLDSSSRLGESEQLLAEYARQIADLRRENTRLSIQLSTTLPESDAARYESLRRELREVIKLQTSRHASILVVSKGDRALLELDGRRTWHFPQDKDGVYAGHHPADSREAIEHLECLRARGATHLLIPATSLWWLDYYKEFYQHLESRFQRLPTPQRLCALYCLTKAPQQSPAKIRRPETDHSPASVDSGHSDPVGVGEQGGRL